MLEEITRKNSTRAHLPVFPVPEPGSGMQAGLPEEVRFRVRFARARRILSLDCDFLHQNPY